MLQFNLHQSCYYFNNAVLTHVILDLLKITTIFQTLPYQITTNLINSPPPSQTFQQMRTHIFDVRFLGILRHILIPKIIKQIML
jgi:hypothetical protein